MTPIRFIKTWETRSAKFTSQQFTNSSEFESKKTNGELRPSETSSLWTKTKKNGNKYKFRDFKFHASSKTHEPTYIIPTRRSVYETVEQSQYTQICRIKMTFLRQPRVERPPQLTVESHHHFTTLHPRSENNKPPIKSSSYATCGSKCSIFRRFPSSKTDKAVQCGRSGGHPSFPGEKGPVGYSGEVWWPQVCTKWLTADGNTAFISLENGEFVRV